MVKDVWPFNVDIVSQLPQINQCMGNTGVSFDLSWPRKVGKEMEKRP